MANHADAIANQILREIDRTPICDSPSCVERATQPKASCPHGRRLPREGPKPKERNTRDWGSASDADVRKELRRLGLRGHL